MATVDDIEKKLYQVLSHNEKLIKENEKLKQENLNLTLEFNNVLDEFSELKNLLKTQKVDYDNTVDDLKNHWTDLFKATDNAFMLLDADFKTLQNKVSDQKHITDGVEAILKEVQKNIDKVNNAVKITEDGNIKNISLEQLQKDIERLKDNLNEEVYETARDVLLEEEWRVQHMIDEFKQDVDFDGIKEIYGVLEELRLLDYKWYHKYMDKKDES